MRRGRLQVVPKSGTMPSRGPKVATKWAELPATAMSQPSARPRPPPAATPLTRAIVGTGQATRARSAGWKIPSMICSTRSATSPCRTALRSAPEQKARPAPVTTTTLTLSSSETAPSAAVKSRINASFIEFNDSGRSRVIVATPPSTAYRTVPCAVSLMETRYPPRQRRRRCPTPSSSETDRED